MMQRFKQWLDNWRFERALSKALEQQRNREHEEERDRHPERFFKGGMNQKRMRNHEFC